MNVLIVPSPEAEGSGMLVQSSAYKGYTEGNTTKLMTSSQAATVISGSMFDPVIFLFLSGFSIAAALDRYQINQQLVVFILARVGTDPSKVFLAILCIGVFVSMWVSNIPAAVLNVSFMLPLLRQLPSHSSYPKMSLLGIAFSCNIGGMTTPIASPQNVLAIAAIHKLGVRMSFGEWCLFAVPFCGLMVLLLWSFLQCFFREGLPSAEDTSFRDGVIRCMESTQENRKSPSSNAESPRRSGGNHGSSSPSSSSPNKKEKKGRKGKQEKEGWCSDEESDGFSSPPSPGKYGGGVLVAYEGRNKEGEVNIEFGGNRSESGSKGGKYKGEEEQMLYWTRVVVVVVVMATALMLSIESLHDALGHIGIVALFPTIFFFGGGFLTQTDFESLPWSVLVLMGGGLALGVAVKSSGLLTILAGAVTAAMEGQSLFVVMLTINISVGIIGNFISSTVAAIILMPLIAHLGQHYEHVKMLVVGAAVMCSGSMGLPVSSFPNANSITAKVQT
jgi:di/tricarboxylate transporter